MFTQRIRQPLSWELARHATAESTVEEWVPAQVPGAVQLDWARARGWSEFWRGDNVRSEWADLDESFWTYRARVTDAPRLTEGEELFLVLEGVDYACDVFLDGRWLRAHEGLQGTVEIPLTGRVQRGTTLSVRIRPAPKARREPRDRVQAARSCKPAVAYGWDFHPRLIPLGLWRPAYLERRWRLHFSTPPRLDYRLDDDGTQAAGSLTAVLNRPAVAGCVLRWRLFSPAGQAVHVEQVAVVGGESRVEIPFVLDDVALWWPHDQGAPALYRSVVELVRADGTLADECSWRVGFRRVRLVMAPGQWAEPVEFPKSRSRPPITLEVNGRALFVKGANWVCPDVFPGTLTRARYAEQVSLARASNLGLLRVWGGATAPHGDFFELCDELGVMVWQEFPLACNNYPDDDAYLGVLDGDSRALIARLREHPSVVLWCGGNELFNQWSGMTDQSLALRLLNRNCYELDPTRPFLATAPVEGMGHGHYVFRDPATGAEAWELFQKARCTAYTEFGCAAPASVESLRRILPEDQAWPPAAGTSWETHHAFGAWLPSSHLYPETIEYYFGPAASLEELVECGQLLQGEGLRGLFEESRRQKPVAAMALAWCFNEPWPTAANTSVIGWPCEPKPALRLVAAACRPTLASARVSKFSWSPGETFEAELWLLHDGPEELIGKELHASLELDGVRHPLGVWATGTAEVHTNVRGPRVQLVLPEFTSPRFVLHLEVDGRGEWNSRYTLLQARRGRAEMTAVVNAPKGATNF